MSFENPAAPASSLDSPGHSGLKAETLEEILEVTRKLAAPFDLTTMLEEVINAARRVLHADRGTVFLFEPRTNELIVSVATGMEPIRFPADQGVSGECAQTREIINVTDCYADPRFNPAIDRETGYRSRCMLTLPLIGYEDSLVGVLQLLNKETGVFDDNDERVAAALAAQCAVAIHRVKLLEALLQSEKLDREITVAREIQMSALPKQMPAVPRYDGAGTFKPTDQTGGDLFDFVRLDDGRLFLLLGDATGHGIGPALSATQVRAMIRVALRLGADLDEIYRHTNDQLVDDLPDDRFVTAFLGLLDPAIDGSPLRTRQDSDLSGAERIVLEPGDLLGLISDGIYEYENTAGQQFGQAGVERIIREHQDESMTSLVQILLEAVISFGAGAPQADDITIVLVKRQPE